MRDAIRNVGGARGAWKVLALGLLLASAGCNLEDQGEPVLTGPADQGFNVELTALPDTVNADGVSSSQVRLVLRNQNGEPVRGYAVLFECDGNDRFCGGGSGAGTMTPASSATYVGPIQTGEVMATDNDGVTRVVYTAGTDLRFVTISVRPFYSDATIEYNFTIRSVLILQR
jgi:hypothetical protein